MNDPTFFGFGSLVNRLTHDYPRARPAQLVGWRRVWVRPNFRGLVFLSARPDPGTVLEGLAADVPNGDWAALDERETCYARHPVELTTQDGPIKAQVYAVEARFQGAFAGVQAIPLSYLDVVIQGYLREFGASGVEAFVATTDGWDVPVLNDRSDPVYPRAQALSASETQLVDDHLARLGSEILPPGTVEL